ncbi:MAG: cyclic pyranopterin monophosphate synthase MoaC [Myxococcota bacterium]|jgi:cyclic pyranopterin phosphate synthase|nr:cyclic pyranopterin monophosphate synthase MoaC [Myxococcota bacterium]
MSNADEPAPEHELTHVDAQGRVRMVNIGDKAVTHRVCVARAEVHMAAATLDKITDGKVPKGDVLATSRLAGIQAAKRTHEWIPLAHPLPLDGVEVLLTPDPSGPLIRIEARAETHWRTGVEMEALVAASAAGLTIYDMCKAIDRGMHLEATRLVYKEGGKSGTWSREGESPPETGALS